MWRWVLVVLGFLTGSAAEAGQTRNSFQVGLTITGRASVPATSTRMALTSVPLPRPRPPTAPALTNSQGKSSLAVNGK